MLHGKVKKKQRAYTNATVLTSLIAVFVYFDVIFSKHNIIHVLVIYKI